MKDSPTHKAQKPSMSKFRRSLSSKRVVLVFVLLFAGIGAYLLFNGLAATNFVAQEAEVGATTPATVVTDSTASGGKALQFNAAASTGSFMSYPLQTCTTSINGGSNIVISNRSYSGCRGSSAIVITGANNVYIHDVDFDSNSGDIFLINDTGQIRVENIRARNTGAGRTTNGSGQGEVIQLNNTFDNGTGGIRNIKSFGGNTEDQISVFESGGIDATHPLIIENNHIESPLPSDPVNGALAWSSNSGTCINSSDGPNGHDVIVRNNTVMNCGQAGILINQGNRVTVTSNIIYGVQRPLSNVGLTQWNNVNCACSGNDMDHNRVYWINYNGAPTPFSNSGTAGTLSGLSTNVLQDTTIDPNTLHVVL
ncbi:MAG TPA: hypothetical protein VLF90_00980 [Patescibacteria group bacterium]|nr:hypothetical protein [Patescibacteria group bacterium]